MNNESQPQPNSTPPQEPMSQPSAPSSLSSAPSLTTPPTTSAPLTTLSPVPVPPTSPTTPQVFPAQSLQAPPTSPKRSKKIIAIVLAGVVVLGLLIVGLVVASRLLSTQKASAPTPQAPAVVEYPLSKNIQFAPTMKFVPTLSGEWRQGLVDKGTVTYDKTSTGEKIRIGVFSANLPFDDQGNTVGMVSMTYYNRILKKSADNKADNHGQGVVWVPTTAGERVAFYKGNYSYNTTEGNLTDYIIVRVAGDLGAVVYYTAKTSPHVEVDAKALIATLKLDGKVSDVSAQ